MGVRSIYTHTSGSSWTNNTRFGIFVGSIQCFNIITKGKFGLHLRVKIYHYIFRPTFVFFFCVRGGAFPFLVVGVWFYLVVSVFVLGLLGSIIGVVVAVCFNVGFGLLPAPQQFDVVGSEQQLFLRYNVSSFYTRSVLRVLLV